MISSINYFLISSQQNFLFLNFLFIYSHVHILFGPFLPLLPTASSISPQPRLASRQSLFCPFLQFCWREDISVFASWDKDSYTERFLALLPWTNVLQPKLIHLYLTFSPVLDPLPILTPVTLGFCIAPLQWGHQTLSCFGFPTYPHTSHMCSPLITWLKSDNIGVFALDLKSAYEGEHTILGLMSLANLAQNDVLQFHLFTWE
jgi:hypothetical protein